MARLIGEKPRTISEEVLYRFAMEKLPDYIYVSFSAEFQSAGRVMGCDAIFFIPHLGVFILEVNGATKLDIEGGQIMLTYGNGMTRPWPPAKLQNLRYAVIEHAINQCDAFMILLSSTSQTSKEVRIEFEKALELEKKILPIWIEDCAQDEYFVKALSKYQYRLMSKPDPTLLNEITNVIKISAKERQEKNKNS